MSPILILMTVSTLGVDAGWEPLAGGGHEYTIQIEPALLSLLADGQDLASEVPAHVSVRRFRITVGNRRLARVDGEPAAVSPVAQGESPPKLDSNDAPLAAQVDTAAPEKAPGAEGPAIPLGFREPAEKARPLRLSDHPAAPIDDPSLAAPAESPVSAPARRAAAHNAEKPRLEASAAASSAQSRPWGPLVVAAVLLACSLGANLFLGWIYLEARRRYRDAVAQFRAAPAA